jgi:D-sedoheptulose 7-phosphate isomerase
MTAAALLKKNLEASIAAKQSFLGDAGEAARFEEAAAMVVEHYRKGGRLYIAGNGGSAADAQHIAAEFVGRLNRDRAPLPAEALTVDSSILTAIGNDYSYDEIFSRQVAGKMTANDVFLGITTSGNSKNIVRALEVCRERGLASIVFTGHEGGAAKALADHCIIAHGHATSTIQEIHLVLAHSLCEAVDLAMFGDHG